MAPVKNCRQSAIGSFLTIFVKKNTNQRGAWHITEKMLMHSKWIFMYVAAGRGPGPVYCCTSIADWGCLRKPVIYRLQSSDLS